MVSVSKKGSSLCASFNDRSYCKQHMLILCCPLENLLSTCRMKKSITGIQRIHKYNTLLRARREKETGEEEYLVIQSPYTTIKSKYYHCSNLAMSMKITSIKKCLKRSLPFVLSRTCLHILTLTKWEILPKSS